MIVNSKKNSTNNQNTNIFMNCTRNNENKENSLIFRHKPSKHTNNKNNIIIEKNERNLNKSKFQKSNIDFNNSNNRIALSNQNDITNIKNTTINSNTILTNFFSVGVHKIQKYKNNLLNKLKLLILEEHSNTPYYIIFNSIIFFVNSLNFIYLMTLHYGMGSSAVKNIFFVNVICSVIFVIEIIFKILVLGKEYFKDLMNILDLVVIFSGIAEIIVTNINLNADGNFYLFIKL